MSLTFWEAFGGLSGLAQALFFLALFTAFAFEFINGFHDTANAVTTVIYTKTLRPTPAVFFSGFMNFLGVLVGGTTVAFSIVNLLPVDLRKPQSVREVHDSARSLQAFLDQKESDQESTQDKSAKIQKIHAELSLIASVLDGKQTLSEVAPADRWAVRQSIYRVQKGLAGLELSKDAVKTIAPARDSFKHAIEYVPLWVVIGVALALGIGTTIGYKRIVATIAEKIGKTHLTYAQGAAAESVAALTIGLTDMFHAPVSTTQVLSSGIAGTMWAKNSGVQIGTIRKILIAWALTLPMAILLGGCLFFLGVMAFDGVKLH